MEDRKDFLRSKLETHQNIFNLVIPYTQEHRFIFDRLAENFRPASKITEDIKELVTGDLNLCRDKNILIFYRGDGLKLNTLKFYLLMNFISNWKLYRDYIQHLVVNDTNNSNSLSYQNISLEGLAEMRFRDEDIKEAYRTDILFLTVKSETRLFDNKFYKDLFGTIINLRNSKGLITVAIYLGTEKSYNEKMYEESIIEIPIKKYNLTGISNTANKTRLKNNTLDTNDDAEVF